MGLFRIYFIEITYKKGFVSVFLLAYYLHSLKVKRFHDHYEQL